MSVLVILDPACVHTKAKQSISLALHNCSNCTSCAVFENLKKGFCFSDPETFLYTVHVV